MARDVVIVPHTHWDREWYAPFQTFRLRLVELVDQLLDLLERGSGLRPLHARRADGGGRRLPRHAPARGEPPAPAGRRRPAGHGPWYILMDEFLVSGETIVRDLQLGLDRAAAFGGASPVGYLPDMFGHIAQMPQLLRQAGFEHTVVWRGVPAAMDRSGFWWEAPDGSTVRAEYLPAATATAPRCRPTPRSWSTPSPASRTSGEPARRPRPLDERHRPPAAPAVARPGRGRGQRPPGRLPAAGRLAGRGRWQARGRSRACRRWTGELRSGSRANLLMGVASNRIDVKQAAAAAERWIERLRRAAVAPCTCRPDEWPAPFLDEAWREMIRNSAHDSICACSHDEVCSRRARTATRRPARSARAWPSGRSTRLAALVGEAGPVVVNPSARTRSGLVEVDRRRPRRRRPAPSWWPASAATTSARASPRPTPSCWCTPPSPPDPHLLDAEVGHDDDGVLDVRMHHDRDRTDRRYVGPVLAEVRAAAAADPAAPARFTLSTPPDAPGAGPCGRRARLRLVAVRRPRSTPVTVAGGDGTPVTVANGLVTVDGRRRRHVLAGDDRREVPASGAWSTTATPATPTTTTRPRHDIVRRHARRGGRAGGRGRPAAGPGGRRPALHVARRGGRRRAASGRWPVATTTVIEVVAGSPLVRLTTELDNPARDHRLRVWFPLPEPADRVARRVRLRRGRAGRSPPRAGRASGRCRPSRRAGSCAPAA